MGTLTKFFQKKKRNGKGMRRGIRAWIDVNANSEKKFTRRKIVIVGYVDLSSSAGSYEANDGKIGKKQMVTTKGKQAGMDLNRCASGCDAN